MTRDSSLLVITLLLLVLPSLMPPPGVSAQTPLSLYEKTRRVIPGNLPWYPLIIIGDNRPSDVNAVDPPGVFYQAVNEAENALPLAFIGLGDHVGLGTLDQYVKLYEILNKTRLENIWMTPGNHDVAYSGVNGTGFDFWRQFIGPDSMVVDDIPGWRIALIDSETDISTWGQQIQAAYNSTGGRMLLLGFHRPLYPNVNHNLKQGYDTVLLGYMNSNGWPALVLQAHFHAWVSYRYNGTEFLIVGGTGAPLYSCTDVSAPGAVCSSTFHYLVLTLYPNGTYTYTPVKLGEGSGTLRVIPLNSTAYLVANSKIDVYGNPVEYPVRLRFKAQGLDVYVVARIPASSGVVFALDPATGRLLVSQGVDYYVYIASSNGSIVVNGGSRELDLSQYLQGRSVSVETPVEVVKAETVTSTSIAYITRTATKTITSTYSTTLTETSVTTVTETQQLPPTTITVQRNVTSTYTTTVPLIVEHEAPGGDAYLYIAAVLGVIAVAELAVIIFVKKK
ncbi:metallophosphoesterase family protein [Desulfurococcus mucosus]|uniref:Metallophosphoesterase, calcineurin superfamily n=1 Tax=Desulfurococcus mucosus (strain ATCC 35584 / DSM 2162 / JCM 9187 / O7/1) TaxID=765177 RepID=E8R8I8_DESM0|nr:metallophosphoesterase [Desulfurococcus mucosus]ADV64814.1 metallophosphoesterase, calcineurin superfamily [Desulfurococcus mucosus DSM 2162]